MVLIFLLVQYMVFCDVLVGFGDGLMMFYLFGDGLVFIQVVLMVV